MLQDLKEDDLVKILTEPKNAMIKQFTKLLAMEGVGLTFTPSALRELANIACQKGTGARGLRAILEHLMLDVMYDVPMKKNIKQCRITKSVVTGHRPALVQDDDSRRIA